MVSTFGKKVRGWVCAHPKASIFWGIVLLHWLFCLPNPLFDAPFSTIVEDRTGRLLGARIAADGQWRFPISMQMPLPEKYVAAVVAYEDKRFWWHCGFDPVAVVRALYQNIRTGRVVSGGSTLTQQVIRLSRGNPGRTVFEKLYETYLATRLELTHRKSTILRLYAAHAPFGGNVVGLETAAWRYFSKSPQQMSWAEAALLAVLPNAPALLHPGKNRQELQQKRDRLLAKLAKKGLLSPLELDLALSEAIPAQPQPLPQLTPHLLDRFWVKQQNRTRSTVDIHLQTRLTEILQRRQAIYRGNGIHNLAAVVMDVPRGEILAYCGNVPGAGAAHGESVDVLVSPRSTGSILKPFLYAFALQQGDILPRTLLADVPTQMGNYKPENFHAQYDGLVSAQRALIRSLNVPFVWMLKNYGVEKWHRDLQNLGLTTLTRSSEHYGLSLVLGGAEAKLLELTNIYACMARVLVNFYPRNGKYAPDDFRPARWHLSTPDQNKAQLAPQVLGAAAIWHTFDAMQHLERPNAAGEWEIFRTARRIAWKTGTSFGFRDAWAVGVTPQFAVGVWVGNADGEGRPGLIGVEVAAPVLFDIFAQLPNDGTWFDPPFDDMTPAPVCRLSGFRATEICPADTLWIPKTGLKSAPCPYHKILHLDASERWQVNSQCASTHQMVQRAWFVLPPLEEFYFKNKNAWYVPPPPLRPDCAARQLTPQHVPMQFIYPKKFAKIAVPTELDGSLGKTIFQVAHRDATAEIHWHLDQTYLGSTRTFHQMALQPAPGKHVIALVDNAGFRLEQVFEVLK